MATIQKNDFVELEFTGKANTEVFDTTSPEEAKKIGIEDEVKPVIVSVGNEMLLKSFDEDLVGKEIGKSYSLKLTPDKAFGKRNPKMIRTVPIKVFHDKQMNPYPGLTVQMDNYIAKILSVSGGRVSVDFNNPLAGKEVSYDYQIKRKVEDANEKINALQDFFFRSRFEFEIKENKVIFKKPEIKPFIDVFKEKFKAITGLDFEVVEKKDDKKPAVKIEELVTPEKKEEKK
jgi:FKBP-type peptidyl-prolyl cis-trans isomerase 2